MSGTRTLHSALIAAALATLPTGVATPQSQQPVTPPVTEQQAPSPAQDVTLTTPQQFRRVDPPSPLSSQTELEQSGDILRAEKLYPDAVDYYEAALKKGERAQLHNKIGIADLQMLKINAAKKQFERATKVDPTIAEAFNNLGVADYVQMNFKGAIKNYEKAIKINPNSASFHSNLGSALFSRREYQRASQEYATALTIDPEIFDRHSNAGVSAHLASPQDRARYSYVIAKMFAQRHDADRCLEYLRKAMEEGYKVQEEFAKDPEFDGYRKDPRFIAVLSHKPEPLPR